MLLKTKEIFATLNSLGAKPSIFLVKTFCITTFCNTIYALLSVKIISSNCYDGFFARWLQKKSFLRVCEDIVFGITRIPFMMNENDEQ